MKTSIKLLLGLGLALLIAMFGAAVSIQHQYDSIDKSDKYSRWQKKPLLPFHAVSISGPSAAVVLIEPGNTTRLLVDSLGLWRKPMYTYKVDRDTLFLHLSPMEGWTFNDYVTNGDWNDPQLVVQLPKLVAVSTTNSLCQIAGFKGDVLALQQTIKGNMLVKQLTYNQLHAALSGRNRLLVYGVKNKIGKAIISVRDSSQFSHDADFLQGLTLTADPTAKLRLTGKALQQVKE
ncbi:hypothetical protein [Fibrella arboris]|uniref:hypothetical protein n=1 Tax=Fibrella arboris TaxID=3242486 RepID=UPI0035229B29